MKKIHCLFKREQIGSKYLAIPEYSEDAGHAPNRPTRATVKWDGTACLLHEGQLYARRKLKLGAESPEGWRHWRFQKPRYDDLHPPRTSGHGWVPVDVGVEYARHRDAYVRLPENPPDGTYELVGPGIQSNPYEQEKPTLILHGVHIIETVSIHGVSALRAFQTIEAFLSEWWMEGIVFWDDDNEPVAKITKRDFGFAWPSTEEVPNLRGSKLVTP